MSAGRVVIVEDHALVRTGLRVALRGIGMSVVGEAEDGIEGARIIESERPDVAIVDLGLPGKDGIAVAREAKAMVPPPRVVVLTMRERENDVLAALTAGADGYCVKASGEETLLDAVRTVAAGGAFFDPRIAHVVLRRLSSADSAVSGDSPLSPRETDILRLIADGVSNAEIAGTLHISLATVKTHVASILRKLAASDRAHAAAIAFRAKILS